MKKVLFCASTLSHITSFHLPYLQAFAQQGWEVWVAANETGPIPCASHVVALPFTKRFFSPQNIRAIFAARKLLKEQQFTLISAHTTLAGAVCRAAVWLLRRRPQVVYTCHGYLFHQKGLKKWAYLLPEKICAPVTNVLLVMNQEDLQIARRFHLYKNHLALIPGMGFSSQLFSPLPQPQREAKRAALSIGPKQVVFIYAAEFSQRKNHSLLLHSFAAAAKQMPTALLFLAGDGSQLTACQQLVQQLGIGGQVRFLGHVHNMADWYPLCDIVVSPSQAEGLPFHLMEAMSCGLPAVVSDIKGHRDLISPGKNGLLFPLGDTAAFAQAMVALYCNGERRLQYGQAARETAGAYGLSQVLPQVLKEYPLSIQ